MNLLRLFPHTKKPFLKFATPKHVTSKYIVIVLRILVFLTLTYLELENIDVIERMTSVKSFPSTADL